MYLSIYLLCPIYLLFVYSVYLFYLSILSQGRIVRRDRDGSYIVEGIEEGNDDEDEEEEEEQQEEINKKDGKRKRKRRRKRRKEVRIYDPQRIVKISGYEKGETVEFRANKNKNNNSNNIHNNNRYLNNNDIQEEEEWVEGIIHRYDAKERTYEIRKAKQNATHNIHSRYVYLYLKR